MLTPIMVEPKTTKHNVHKLEVTFMNRTQQTLDSLSP